MELRFGDVLCISGGFLAKSDRTLSFLGGVLFFSMCDTKLLTIKKQCDTIVSEGGVYMTLYETVNRLYEEHAFEIKEGDIIRVEDWYHSEPHYYEVSSKGVDFTHTKYAKSQPADYEHDYRDITAVYRLKGKDFICVWEIGDKRELI